jgi:hypothetical protein
MAGFKLNDRQKSLDTTNSVDRQKSLSSNFQRNSDETVTAVLIFIESTLCVLKTDLALLEFNSRLG